VSKSKLSFVLLGITVLLLTISAQAGKFSEMGGYGNSTVGGANADYNTLYDAATDFNAYAGGCRGDWTLWIDTNSNETIQSFFGNTVAPYFVTIRPTAGETKTINFSYTDPAGISGAMIIGANQMANMNVLIKTDNFNINGSPDETDAMNLVLTARGSIANCRIVRVFGNSDNFTIKNCYVLNTTTATSAAAAISFTSRVTTGSLNVLIPDNCTVSHCYIAGSASAATGAGIEFGFSTSAGYALSQGYAATGLVIEKSTIFGRSRGIFLNNNAGTTISNNTIRINQTVTGYLSQAIYHASGNNATGWKMDIYNNVFDQMTTANVASGIYGLAAMDLSGAGGLGTTATYNIYNNIISAEKWGFAATATQTAYWGIRCGSAYANYNIYHNSIYMPAKSALSASSTNATNSIAITSPSYQGTANVYNNLVKIGQLGGTALYFFRNTGTYNSDYNDLVVYGGASTGLDRNNVYASLANWQTASSVDSHSQTVDPMATAPAVWSATDLHFSPALSSAAPLLAVPRLAAVLTDIDGENRADPCWPGADEHVSVAVPVELSSFNIE
jgi:hypothetical protein